MIPKAVPELRLSFLYIILLPIALLLLTYGFCLCTSIRTIGQMGD